MAHSLSFLEQKALDFKNPAFKKELDNLQANILKGHGRNNTAAIFLQFEEAKITAIKKWLRDLDITTAYKQLSDRDAYKKTKAEGAAVLHDGGPVHCFFLTASGYRKLGIDASNTPAESAFKNGMRSRRVDLKDPGADEWQKEYQPETDAMLLVADELPRLHTVVRNSVATIENTAGITINIIQWGEALKKDGMGIEHFGYADALSQPEYLDDYIPGKVWNDGTVLGAVLVPDPAALQANNNRDSSCYGSYFVFRKLEQHVKAFKEMEESLADILLPGQPEDALKEVAGAYAVGRFENSTPVIKHSTEVKFKEGKDPVADNDFNYSNTNDVSRCPYHAHIRLTNPRKSNLSEMGKAIPGYKAPDRITRRGIPFDEAGRNNDMNWLPDGKVGLLFMAYQNSIEKCFETMQKSANIADGIIGQKTGNAHQLWPVQWGNEAYQLKGFGFSDFVTMKGGEYFFAPSIPFLKKLGSK